MSSGRAFFYAVQLTMRRFYVKHKQIFNNHLTFHVLEKSQLLFR